MQPDIGIVRTYRRSYGLSTIPDDLNTLTHQYAYIDNNPREPLHGPIKNQCTIALCLVVSAKKYLRVLIDAVGFQVPPIIFLFCKPPLISTFNFQL